MNNCTLVVIAASLAGSALFAGEMTIVENGASDYVIALPGEGAEAQKVREAADALQKYVAESTGAKLPVVGEGEVGTRPAFYLGHTRRGEAAGVTYGRLVHYVNCRKVMGRDVFLAGCDDSVGVTGPLQTHDREYLGQREGLNLRVKDLSYRRLHGTLKAVLGYLESERAVEFLMPGEAGRNLLAHPTWKVRDDLDWVGSNDLPYSFCHCYGDLHTTIALGQTDVPFYRHWGGHPLPEALPREKYEKSHPEYFILKDGRRRPDFGPAKGGHPCVSNPEVQDLLVAYLKKQYDIGYRWIQVGPTDGQVACECEACWRMNEDPHERQWLFCKAICEKAEKIMPDAKLVLLSYDFTKMPPKTFDRMPGNAVLEMCIWHEDFDEHFKAWEKFREVPKFAYVYFFGAYHSTAFGPTMSPKSLARRLRTLKRNHVIGIFKCGWACDIGLEAPDIYAYSRLLEDVERDPDKLVDEFCDRAYGKAADPMKRFFRALYGGLDTPRGNPFIYELHSRPHGSERMFQAMFTPGNVSYLGRLLTIAEGTRGLGEKERTRLKLVRRSYDFLAIRSKCYTLEAAWGATHAKEILPVADRVYDERERLLDGWYDDRGRMKWVDGIYWPFMLGASRKLLVEGGGACCPCFPSLFRPGTGSVKELLKKNAAPGK